MARTPEKEGYSPPMPPVAPPRQTLTRPLTMLAPAEALARVYAAAYTAERHTTDARLFPDGTARDVAADAVRAFCALCTEEFGKPE